MIESRSPSPPLPPLHSISFLPIPILISISLFLHLPCFVLALALLLSGPRHISVPDHLLHPSPSTRLSIRFWSLHLFLLSRLASPYPNPDRQKFVVLAIPSTFCHTLFLPAPLLSLPGIHTAWPPAFRRFRHHIRFSTCDASSVLRSVPAVGLSSAVVPTSALRCTHIPLFSLDTYIVSLCKYLSCDYTQKQKYTKIVYGKCHLWI